MRKSNRAAAGAAAWRVVHAGTGPGGPSLWSRVKALPRLLGARLSGRYTGMARSRPVLFAIALAYIVSPIDAIPELVVPILGFADDVGVAVWLAGALMRETERFLEWECDGHEYPQGRVVA